MSDSLQEVASCVFHVRSVNNATLNDTHGCENLETIWKTETNLSFADSQLHRQTFIGSFVFFKWQMDQTK